MDGNTAVGKDLPCEHGPRNTKDRETSTLEFFGVSMMANSHHS